MRERRLEDEVQADGHDSSAPLVSELVERVISGFVGINSVALHPDDEKLYVSEPGAVNVYGVTSGQLLTSIVHPDIVDPTGVCVGRTPASE